jgi:hypothetical protein
MPTPFWPATAEQAMAAVEAVTVNINPSTAEFVGHFVDIGVDRALSALKLACDIGFLSESGDKFSVHSPLCRCAASPKAGNKAAVLRVALESYRPFCIFRERLVASGDADRAARETKALLNLDADRDEIKDTLVSLGTYGQALESGGGGRYLETGTRLPDVLRDLSEACVDLRDSERRIEDQIGHDMGNPVVSRLLSRDEVLTPLAQALQCARDRDSRSAVLNAGNAVESFLVILGTESDVNLERASGMIKKLDCFNARSPFEIPAKLRHVGYYLGHIRNAADHGVDRDVAAAWTIRESTGLEYVFVACSFIAAVITRHRDLGFEI